MRDFKNNCFKKEFSLISTEKKAIVDILFFWNNTTMWLLSFSFSRLFLLLCNAGGILEFKTREKILPKSSQHSIDQGIDNNDLKLIFSILRQSLGTLNVSIDNCKF